MSQQVETSARELVSTRSSQPENGHLWKNAFSSVYGRFRVETTEIRRVHVHSSLLIVTSNQNTSKKKKIV